MSNYRNFLIPNVIKKTSDGERGYDIYSLLLENRNVMLGEEVTEDVINVVIAQLLYLDSVSHDPIMLYINSPGGSVIQGLNLCDIMNSIQSPVYTCCLGEAASMGAVILSAGEKGHRMAMKNSKILVHPQSGGTRGRTNDNVIAMNFEKRLQESLLALLAKNCGHLTEKEYNEIENAVQNLRDKDEIQALKISDKTKTKFDKFKQTCNYDHWMFTKEALEYGIIDEVVDKI